MDTECDRFLAESVLQRFRKIGEMSRYERLLLVWMIQDLIRQMEVVGGDRPARSLRPYTTSGVAAILIALT